MIGSDAVAAAISGLISGVVGGVLGGRVVVKRSIKARAQQGDVGPGANASQLIGDGNTVSQMTVAGNLVTSAEGLQDRVTDVHTRALSLIRIIRDPGRAVAMALGQLEQGPAALETNFLSVTTDLTGCVIRVGDQTLAELLEEEKARIENLYRKFVLAGDHAQKLALQGRAPDSEEVRGATLDLFDKMADGSRLTDGERPFPRNLTIDELDKRIRAEIHDL